MNNKTKKKNRFLYEKVVEDISNEILNGTFKADDRLPAVRKLSEDLGVSKNTVLQSYAFGKLRIY